MFNFPNTETKDKSHKKVSAKREDKSINEQNLIDKAVDMTKSGRVGMMTDANAPHFILDEFQVTESGELERATRSFSRNINPNEFGKFRDSHKRCAQTYNASYVSCADDYTAYIWNGGKSVSVYYYNYKDSAEA